MIAIRKISNDIQNTPPMWSMSTLTPISICSARVPFRNQQSASQLNFETVPMFGIRSGSIKHLSKTTDLSTCKLYIGIQ